MSAAAAAPPPSRKSVVRKADVLLSRLLRTPKTRAGLLAAIQGSGVSRNFLYGWLSDQVRTGAVAPLKSTKPVSYQLAHLVIAEQPPPGLYPSWLEPRTLPASASRRAYLNGKPVGTAGAHP
jgi:hypothetical protein